MTIDNTSSGGTRRPYRIVIGLSFDETGEIALREGFAIAAARGDAELHAVHTVPGLAPAAGTRSIEKMNEVLDDVPRKVSAFVEERRATAPGAEAYPVFAHVRTGNPADAIHQCAIDYEADLIVVGTRNRKGLARLALGSVSSTLVEKAHCPVLVARPRDFAGLARSERVEPLCADCEATRKTTDGEQLWCEYHGRPHVKVHTYGGSGWGGSHNPSVIPPGTGM